jgi:HEAT repeat protein
MTKSARAIKLTVVLVLAVFLAVGLASLLLAPKEPSYQGRGLSSWLDEWARAYDDPRNEAATAIRGIGSNAVPILLARLSHHQPPRHQAFWRSIRRFIPDQWNPIYRQITDQVTAANALNLLGTNAQSAFPSLTNLFWSKREAVTAAIALAGMGSQGVSELLSAMTNKEWTLRLYAIGGLGNARFDFDRVVPALIEIVKVKETNQEERLLHDSARIALDRVSGSGAQVAPAVSELLKSADPEIRRDGVMILGNLMCEAKTAETLLAQMRSDTNSEVREAVENAFNLLKDYEEELDHQKPAH